MEELREGRGLMLFGKVKSAATILLSCAMIFIIFKLMFFTEKETGIAVGENTRASAFMFAKSDGHVVTNSSTVRQCLNTERQCPGSERCRGADGKVTGGTATTPNGFVCCRYECESQKMERRPCKSTERKCGLGKACRFANTIVAATAIDEAGRTCCAFDCDDVDPPVRACFGTEALCPAGSYCYDFNGSVNVPNARSPNGNSCCSVTTQGKNPCVAING